MGMEGIEWDDAFVLAIIIDEDTLFSLLTRNNDARHERAESPLRAQWLWSETASCGAG
jgi:hypothetical protein